MMIMNLYNIWWLWYHYVSLEIIWTYMKSYDYYDDADEDDDDDDISNSWWWLMVDGWWLLSLLLLVCSTIVIIYDDDGGDDDLLYFADNPHWEMTIMTTFSHAKSQTLFIINLLGSITLFFFRFQNDLGWCSEWSSMSTFCLGRTYCSESLLFAQKLYFMDGWVFVSLALCIFEVVGRSVSILCHLQKMVSWPRCRYCNLLFPIAWQFWDFQILLSDRLVISWMRRVCWAHGDTVNILTVLPQWFCFDGNILAHPNISAIHSNLPWSRPCKMSLFKHCPLAIGVRSTTPQGF